MIRFVAMALVLSLAGCGLFRPTTGSGVSPVPLPFKTSLSRGEDTRDFAVAARAGGANVPAVRESVRFAATRYCLPTFGGSDVAWRIDPATQDWAFTRDGEDMIFSGRCTAR